MQKKAGPRLATQSGVGSTWELENECFLCLWNHQSCVFPNSFNSCSTAAFFLGLESKARFPSKTSVFSQQQAGILDLLRDCLYSELHGGILIFPYSFPCHVLGEEGVRTVVGWSLPALSVREGGIRHISWLNFLPASSRLPYRFRGLIIPRELSTTKT